MELVDLYYDSFDNQEYNNCILILNKMELTKEDTAWINAKLAECYYELRNYNEAIRYCSKSLKVQPEYPLPLWTMANAYYYIKDYNMAKRIFINISKMAIDKIGKKETKMGVEWAQSLIHDCKITLADCCYMLLQDTEAKKYLDEYERNEEIIITCLPDWYVRDIKEKITTLSTEQ
jgi:tetratricopeptide (TPR) repeat protein